MELLLRMAVLATINLVLFGVFYFVTVALRSLGEKAPEPLDDVLKGASSIGCLISMLFLTMVPGPVIAVLIVEC